MLQEDYREAIRASALFEGCNPDSIPYTACTYHAGQIISDRPQGIPSIGLIADGRIDVFSVALDGRDIQLNSLSRGECFGICNLFTSGQLDTVLQCGCSTTVLYMAKSRVLKQMEQSPELALRYATLCNEKLQFLIHRIEQLTMQSCRSKLLAYLLSHLDAEGKVELHFSREDWARHLGVSRAALFRELAQLQEQGVLHSQGNILITPGRTELENLLYRTGGEK